MPEYDEAVVDALRRLDAALGAVPYRTVGGLPSVEREHMFQALNEVARALLGQDFAYIVRGEPIPADRPSRPVSCPEGPAPGLGAFRRAVQLRFKCAQAAVTNGERLGLPVSHVQANVAFDAMVDLIRAHDQEGGAKRA